MLSAGLYVEARTPAFRDRIRRAGKAEHRRIYCAKEGGLSIHSDAALKRVFHEAGVGESLQFESMGVRDSKVLTIDIGDYCQAAAAQPLWRRYVEFYLGSSTDKIIVQRIAERVRNKRSG